MHVLSVREDTSVDARQDEIMHLPESSKLLKEAGTLSVTCLVIDIMTASMHASIGEAQGLL